MIRRLPHLGMLHFFHLILCEELISKILSLIHSYKYFQIIIPPRRESKGGLRRNVEEQELPNSLEVQPQREVTNAEFWEAILILSQVVTNQFGKQIEARQEGANTLRFHEFVIMNPLSFTR